MKTKYKEYGRVNYDTRTCGRYSMEVVAGDIFIAKRERQYERQFLKNEEKPLINNINKD